MLCIVNERGIIERIVATDYNTRSNWKKYYPWNTIGATYDVNPPDWYVEQKTQQTLTSEVQAHLDSKAQERNYDNIHTACTYINSSDSVFAAEASALLLWRDKVWRECYSILDDVKAGRRPIPSVSELLAELPEFHWPDEAVAEEQ